LISKLQNNLQSGSAIRYLPIGYPASNSSEWKIYTYIRQNCDWLNNSYVSTRKNYEKS